MNNRGEKGTSTAIQFVWSRLPKESRRCLLVNNPRESSSPYARKPLFLNGEGSSPDGAETSCSTLRSMPSKMKGKEEYREGRDDVVKSARANGGAGPTGRSSLRLCVVKDLSTHDVVMRIMRKDNFLIGMLNKGVLAMPIPRWVLGVGPVVHEANGTENRLMLTKTLEWTLNWCILHNMFDRNFSIRTDFINNPMLLRKRLIAVGFGMLILSPFLIIFMLVYFFLRHAEQFYNCSSTVACICIWMSSYTAFS